MLRLLSGLTILSLLLLTGCSKKERTNVLVPDGSPSFAVMDFSKPLPLDPLPEGWYHRKFLRHPPMGISFVTKEGYPSIRLSTNDSASMLFRYVDIELNAYPLLSWDWFIEQGIVSDLDEMTASGDDHPARIYLGFRSAGGKSHNMEIIWGNRKLHRGDWKFLKFLHLFSFPHYVADGGNENIGRWRHEREDLTALYSTLWGDAAGARLMEIALFCDTDETGTKSIAYFSNIRVEKRQP